MKDQSKKLQELQESNHAIFEGLFGKKAPEQTGNGQVVKLAVGKYRMGKSVITGIQGTSDSEILNYDFENSKLNWLLDSHFEGILNLDLKRGELEAFAGVWKSGTFQGKIFGNGSTFEGGQFGIAGQIKPKYVPAYDSWKTSPLNFGDGTIDRDTGGILGIPNAPNEQIKGDINIISIQPGKSITIKLRDNVVHTIKFLKRIDNTSSDFTIETINGDTKERLSKTFEWADSKQALNKPFNPYKTKAFLGLDLSAGVVSATISTSGKDSLTHKPQGAAGEATPGSLSKQVQSMKLAEIPFLKIARISRGKGTTKQGAENLYFNFPTPSHQAAFEKVVKSLKSGWVKSYVTQIKTAMDNNIIKGAPLSYKYLSNIIGKDPDADVATMDKELVNAFNGMENFLKYFVNTTVRRVRKTGPQAGLTDVEDKIGRETINNKLKELMGIVPAPAPAANTTKKGTPSNKGKLAGGPPAALQEDIRNSVREIISKNMKHF